MQVIEQKFEPKTVWKKEMRKLEVGGGCLVAPIDKRGVLQTMAAKMKSEEENNPSFTMRKEDGLLKIWRVA